MYSSNLPKKTPKSTLRAIRRSIEASTSSIFSSREANIATSRTMDTQVLISQGAMHISRR